MDPTTHIMQDQLMLLRHFIIGLCIPVTCRRYRFG